MYAIIVTVIIFAILHITTGLGSVCIGVASSIQAEIWLAHTVSPIWSGAFFIFTGILGLACARRKTAYLIMCFTAFSVVSLVTAVVSIQLLRLGLVNHTTDGHTFQKEEKDVLILFALGGAGFEILLCLITLASSCRLAKAAKKDMFEKRADLFHVQVIGEKEIEVVVNKNIKNKKKNRKNRTSTSF